MRSSEFPPNEINKINQDDECYTQEMRQKYKQKKESEKTLKTKCVIETKLIKSKLALYKLLLSLLKQLYISKKIECFSDKVVVG